MGGDEFSGDAVCVGKIGVTFGILYAGIFAEVGDDLVVFIEDGDPAMEVRDQEFIALLVEVAGVE